MRSAEYLYKSYVIKVLETDFGVLARPFLNGRWLRDIADHGGATRLEAVSRMQAALDDLELETDTDQQDGIASDCIARVSQQAGAAESAASLLA
ncbi:hypothetical protein IBL26_24295 [Roseomonas aerophila]|uniref:Uncharacterized protein n=1 Tax=Teichococcus aerophilus TaxID=1224513 RepID=A0ABR7RTN4_9PROT|nr:hypothetical protein [Pseudoroseomonas aerophila]MBC9209974.1 hypothetical protein [Pseudoroseomonas aerophila]